VSRHSRVVNYETEQSVSWKDSCCYSIKNDRWAYSINTRGGYYSSIWEVKNWNGDIYQSINWWEFFSNGDWDYVFAYANGEQSKPDFLDNKGKKSTINCIVDYSDLLIPIATADGENDGPGWIGIFQLKNGKYFGIEASCDYTGWG